ncbi:MAG: cytochrome c [Oligoflexia bacterium]|nr:cytochrome c [Oligoflexia bacterium]
MHRAATIVLAALLFIPLTSRADAAKGKTSYDQRCASCHGPTGAGDGPVAASLPPGTVRNLHTGPFKFATDAAKLKELLQKGGAALGLNPLMPPAAGASDEELGHLVEYVMSLRK